MKETGFQDIGILIVIADIDRRSYWMVSDCLEVWDGMVGELPSFESFCRMYIGEKMGNWKEKARWN